MRIIMITPQWLKTKGGPTTTVYHLANEMRARGHIVEILTSEKDGSAFTFEERAFVREFQIIKLLLDFKPDVIHIHGRVHFVPSAWIYKSLFNQTARILFTFHTQPHIKQYLPNSGPVRIEYEGFRRYAAKLLLNRCDRIVSVSRSLVENLNQHSGLGISRYSVISSGGCAGQTDPSDADKYRVTYRLSDSYPVLSTIGVLSWDWKVAGHIIAIEAVIALRAKYPRVRLLIVGDGPYRSHLFETIERLGVSENVTLCGSVENPQAILELSDIYVHTGLNEGSPLSVIEAMFAGRPIIAVNLGGIPEILTQNQTGILIEPDAERLAEAVAYLLANKDERLRLASNARSYASAKLNWARIAELYLSLFMGRNCPPANRCGIAYGFLEDGRENQDEGCSH